MSLSVAHPRRTPLMSLLWIRPGASALIATGIPSSRAAAIASPSDLTWHVGITEMPASVSISRSVMK